MPIEVQNIQSFRMKDGEIQNDQKFHQVRLKVLALRNLPDKTNKSSPLSRDSHAKFSCRHKLRIAIKSPVHLSRFTFIFYFFLQIWSDNCYACTGITFYNII